MEHAENSKPEREKPFRAEDIEITEPLLKVLADRFGLVLRSWKAFGNWNFSALFWTSGHGGIAISVPKNQSGGEDKRVWTLEVMSSEGEERDVQTRLREILDRDGGVAELTNSDNTNRVEIPAFGSVSELKMKLALLGVGNA